MIFSVIIPIYNVEKYLRECIDSVLSQNFEDYEIILVNDGSPDNCGKICDEYGDKYSHIKVIHKENGGLSDARNFGMKAASGNYLIFLDSDDFWEGTNVLSDLFEIIKRDRNPDVILHGYTNMNNRNEHLQDFSIVKESNNFVNDFDYLVLKGIYYGSVWTKVLKRELVLKNNLFFEKGLLYEDVIYCFDLAFYIKTYSVYQSNFYQYRIREGSITYRVSRNGMNDLIKIINNKIDFLLINGEEILGLKRFILKPLYYSFRNFLRFSVGDVLSLYNGQKQIWEKSCKVWGKDFMIKKYFNNRKIGYLPFAFALFIVYIEQKIYKY